MNLQCSDFLEFILQVTLCAAVLAVFHSIVKKVSRRQQNELFMRRIDSLIAVEKLQVLLDGLIEVIQPSEHTSALQNEIGKLRQIAMEDDLQNSPQFLPHFELVKKTLESIQAALQIAGFLSDDNASHRHSISTSSRI